MPFDGSGNFTRVHNWQQDRDNGIRIVADRHDQEDDNFAQGFNQTFLRSGVVPMAGALNMNNNAIRGIAGGSAVSPTVTSIIDPISGYFSPAQGQLGVAIAGVQRGLWTAAGLSVSGAITTTGDITVGGNLVFSGNLSIPGTLSVTGVSTFNSTTTHHGGITSSFGTFTGDVTVGGDAVFAKKLDVLGLTTLHGGLSVTTINATSSITGGALTATTGQFSGLLTASSGLSTTTINATGSITGGALSATTGLFTGNVQVGGLNSLGIASCAQFQCAGTGYFAGVLTADANANFFGITASTGNFSGALTVTGAVTFGSTVAATGDLVVNKDTYSQNFIAIGSVISPIYVSLASIGLRLQNPDSAIIWTNADASVQHGFINNLATGMTVMNQRPGQPLILGTAGASRFEISADGLNINYPWGGGGDFTVGTALSNYFLGLNHRRNSRILQLEAVSADGNPAITFATGATPVERLSISGTGISTIMPLQLNSGASVFGRDAATNAPEWFVGSVAAGLGSGSGLALFTYSGTQPVNIYTGGTFRMTVAGDGRVGIGTQTPSAAFEVFANPAVGSSFDIRMGSQGQGLDQFSTRLRFGFVTGGVPYSALLGPKDGNGWLGFHTGNADAERMRITAVGQIILTNSDVDEKLMIAGPTNPFMSFLNPAGTRLAFIQAATTINKMVFSDNMGGGFSWASGGSDRMTLSATGNLVCTGTITAFGDITAFSDERFKTNVRKARGLAAICAMEGVTFEHISSKRPSAGVIAQELIKVAPELVHMDDKGHYAVNYNGLAAYFIEAIKELNGLIAHGNTK